MKTVQLTLDEPLVAEVDAVVKELGTSRSAFTREALRTALARRRSEALEARQRQGYERHPVRSDEVEAWEEEQVWPE